MPQVLIASSLKNHRLNTDIRIARLMSYKIFLFRDADGYYWLTGRVDDVINVRCVMASLIITSVIVAHSSNVGCEVSRTSMDVLCVSWIEVCLC